MLRSENIFTFQLTADIGFLEGRMCFQVVKNKPGRIEIKCSERKNCSLFETGTQQKVRIRGQN